MEYHGFTSFQEIYLNFFFMTDKLKTNFHQKKSHDCRQNYHTRSPTAQLKKY